MFLDPVKTSPWFALSIISICLIGAMSTWFSGTVILPELTLRSGLGESEKVWLTNAVQLGFVIGAIVVAFFNLSDSMPLVLLIAFSCTLAAIANLLLIWMDTPLSIIIVRLLTGVALSGVYPPVVKLIATWFQKSRGIAMGVIIGALTLGSAAPHLFRAMTLDTDWLIVIWVSSLMTFLAGMIVVFFVSEGPVYFARTRFKPSQIIQVLNNKPLALVNIGYVGHMWELYAMWAWILTFAHFSLNDFDWIPFGAPEYFSFFIVSIGAIGCVIAGYLSDIYGRCYITAVLMLVSGSCAFSIGFLVNTSPFLFGLIALLWGLTIIADSGQFSAAVTELSAPNLVGTALTVQMAIGFGVTMITIWLVPVFAQLFGSFQWMFLLLAPGPFIGAIAMLVLRRHPHSEKLALGKR
ncbi:MAG: MFS transporter [Alphaproteobacteria bacterium]|nr:MFS transporter [Alphaproteobacteria bacterium]MDG1886941.1 MFS transporter [Alphaproteobacteria bacterium]